VMLDSFNLMQTDATQHRQPYPSVLLPEGFSEAPHAAHPGEAVEEKKEETVSSVFVSDLEAAVKVFVEKWQDHPEGANALAQKHEGELVRQELRPLVFEEVRLQVDDEMRVLLQNLKVCGSVVWKRTEQNRKEKKRREKKRKEKKRLHLSASV